jgi:hypothetical protein
MVGSFYLGAQMKLRYYYLDADHHVVEAPDINTWAKYMRDRRVDYTRINEEVEVITSFVIVDHRFIGSKGPPLVFETMVFGGPLDQEQWRYSSWDDAVVGHQMAVKKVREVKARVGRDQPGGS